MEQTLHLYATTIYADNEPPQRIHEDPPEVIAKCVNCTKADCDDCLAEFDRRYKGRAQKISLEELRIFLRIGDTKAACKHFNCHRSTIWRKLHELETTNSDEKEG